MVVITCGFSIGPIMSKVETPKYKVLSSEKNIEIRLYDPMIVAQTQVTKNRKEAIKIGFSILADYIFGNNTVKQDIAMTAPVQQQSKKIAMTSPVQQQQSQKVSMTAPVQQQLSKDQAWLISFVMPSQYSIESLPKPNDKRVLLKTIPSKKIAAITFSGTNSDSNVTKHKELLIRYINDNRLSALGSPKYAFYNPPWTAPFMRRNEVMIEIN